MNELEIFKNEEFGEVRTVTIDNEPWFVGKDVATALGYENSRDAIRVHIDKEDLSDVVIHDGSQNRHMTAINESGLYSLILGSKLDSAKRFKRWITSDVLPSIRKHGMYAVEELLENPDLLIKVATELRDERQLRKIAEQEKEKLQQRLDYSKEWYSIKRVALKNGVSWKIFDWRKLKAKSIELGYGIIKAFDANYGEVNTYHQEVWEKVYPRYEL